MLLNRISLISIFAFMTIMVTSCTPHIEVSTPTEPITINMNVKIDHEIKIKLDKDVESLINQRSDIF